MIGRESHWHSDSFAVDTSRITSHYPSMLPVCAGRQTRHPALLGLDTRGPLINHWAAPMHHAEHADDADDQPPELEHQRGAISTATNSAIARA